MHLLQTKDMVKPTDTLLVVDAMTGQEAAALVKAFADAGGWQRQWRRRDEVAASCGGSGCQAT
jgi:hypothetical protein